ncbi:MAG: DEAD/DEAH box helicase [Clostridia bacterium]|nr:DEAD/DEAH box helicase [Clostridia bacterium]
MTKQEDANRIFSRFSPFIRSYIYRSGWDELRAVQIEAAKRIFNEECNLLISAETASGKTEAALFPILSMMEKEGPEQLQVLYISPLKSLINDQYSRMEELLQESGMPVYRWHGDVSQSKKQEFLKAPKGLIQITPESLESMLCRRANDIPRLFGALRFVIIDEIHALMGSDRGYQILCQLERIGRLISSSPRRIGLSATIGDPEAALRWLGAGSMRENRVIFIPEDRISWKLALEHFTVTDQGDTEGADPASSFIYRASSGAKCVVFSNSREETEEICSTLRQIAKRKNEEDRFYIHHGNLSAAIREDTEGKLKEDDKNITACATVTLELGIDIGRLRRIINQGSPTSVAGFLQRLGRSGRRGLPPEMLMVFREEEALPNAPVYQLVPWDLVQAIAIIELYRSERWIEPPAEKEYPLSLLFHQTLSILAGKGSMTPANLAKEVLSLPPFSAVTKEDYREMLIHMVKSDYLQRTDEGEVIPGLRGERLISGFKFFAVFQDSEDFTVRCGSEEIGTITATPPIGERFALAGRVWEVEETDVAKRLVFCKSVEGKMKISWPGDSGFIHTRILKQMRKVLSTNTEYPYLMPMAKARLEKARRLSQNTGLDKWPILSLGQSTYVWFPWLGTKAFQTVKRILKNKLSSRLRLYDVQSGGCYYITFRYDGELSALKAALRECVANALSPEELVGTTEYPVYDKYDTALPLPLLQKAYARNRLSKNEWQDALQIP